MPNFYCPTCKTSKKETPTYLKVAQNDPQFHLIKGQKYPFCSLCKPKIKEFNEYDLLNENPHLWDKYPYSDAKEILEKEFGIQIKEENN